MCIKFAKNVSGYIYQLVCVYSEHLYGVKIAIDFWFNNWFCEWRKPCNGKSSKYWLYALPTWLFHPTRFLLFQLLNTLCNTNETILCYFIFSNQLQALAESQTNHVMIQTVSSFQIALICVPSMINVNTANSSASNVRKSNRITVAGGEKNEHCFHSFLMHCANWLTAKNIAWADIIAI